MTTTAPYIETVKRGRNTDIFVCWTQTDSFGKTIAKRSLFDSVLLYEAERTINQAEKLKNAYVR